MTSCKITELKNFMNKLLTTDCFDAFLLEQAVIITYNTFTIDGRLQRDFYTSEEWAAASSRPCRFSCWSAVRPVCYSLIKGRKTPVSMKFILQLKPEEAEKMLHESGVLIPEGYISAFVLTIRYGANGMTCTTGVSYASFLPDKTPELLWDKAFLYFLEKAGIAYEIK